MRQVSDTMRQKLDGEVTRFCRCWKITRQDKLVIGLTDHDADVQFNGTQFHANGGMTASAVETGADLAADEMQLAGVFGGPYLAAADLRKGLFDGAGLQLWFVDWQSPEDALLLMSGRFGQVREQGAQFTVTLESPAAALQNPDARVYQKTCDARLGDEKCRIDLSLAKYRLVSKLLSADGLQLHVSGGQSLAAGLFADGILQFTGGALSDVRVHVRDDRPTASGRVLLLADSLAVPPQKDDSLTLIAGCDKTFKTCRDRFSNSLNFRGMPHLPTAGMLLSVRDTK